MIERRRYERVGLFCPVSLQNNGRAAEGSTLDISLGGVGIVTPAAYALGDMITITFHLKDERGRDAVCSVAGRVASMRADVQTNRVGIEFLEPLREAVQPLLVRKILKL